MKARTINFERGLNPKVAMGIGFNLFDDVKNGDILVYKGHVDGGNIPKRIFKIENINYYGTKKIIFDCELIKVYGEKERRI